MSADAKSDTKWPLIIGGVAAVGVAAVGAYLYTRKSDDGDELFKNEPVAPLQVSRAAAPEAESRPTPTAPPAAATDLDDLADELMKADNPEPSTDSTVATAGGEKDWSKLGLKCSLPPGWSVAPYEGDEEWANMTLKSSALQFRHVSFPPQDQQVAPLNVTLVVEDERMESLTIDELAEKTVKSAETEGPNALPIPMPKPEFQVQEPLRDGSMGPWQYTMEHTQKIPLPPSMQTKEMQLRTFLAMQDGYAYMLQFLGSKEDKQNYKEEFESLARGFAMQPIGVQYQTSAQLQCKDFACSLPAHTAPTKSGKPAAGFRSVAKIRTCAEHKPDIIDFRVAVDPSDNVAAQFQDAMKGSDPVTIDKMQVVNYKRGRQDCCAVVHPEGYVVDVYSDNTETSGHTLSRDAIIAIANSIDSQAKGEGNDVRLMHLCDSLGIGFEVDSGSLCYDTCLSLTTLYYPQGPESKLNITVREIVKDNTRPDDVEGWKQSMAKETPPPKSQQEFTVSGLKAFSFIQEQPMTPEFSYQLMMMGASEGDRPKMENVVLFLPDDRQLAVQCETNVKDFNTHQQIFRQFLGSITVVS